MAREKKSISGSSELQHQEEMTVVVFRFKGGAESMQKGFDAVNSAIAALSPSHASHQRTIVQPTPAQIAPPPTNGKIIDAEVEETPEETTLVGEAEPAANAKPKKSLAPKQSFLSDFSLTPAGVPAWKEFAVQKNPQTEVDKLLVASLWTQIHGGFDPFTGSHLFTCFRAMEWKTQIDMVQPLRRLKLDKSYYENPSHGKWKLTAGIGIPAAEAVGK
ncbi:MAG TPA: hypothetical protein VIY49_19535 [Bryobacteraceae bacterium]